MIIADLREHDCEFDYPFVANIAYTLIILSTVIDLILIDVDVFIKDPLAAWTSITAVIFSPINEHR